jgi:hypothetical protein
VFSTHRSPPTNERQAVARALCARRLLRIGTNHSPRQRAGCHGYRQRHPSRCHGSLVLWQAPSKPYDLLPCRGAVALFAHATVLLAWLRQRHQARRIGSLFVRVPILAGVTALPALRCPAARCAVTCGQRAPVSRPASCSVFATSVLRSLALRVLYSRRSMTHAAIAPHSRGSIL